MPYQGEYAVCIFVRGVANVVCDFVVREIFVRFELFQRLKVAMIIRGKKPKLW